MTDLLEALAVELKERLPTASIRQSVGINHRLVIYPTLGVPIFVVMSHYGDTLIVDCYKYSRRYQQSFYIADPKSVDDVLSLIDAHLASLLPLDVYE